MKKKRQRREPWRTSEGSGFGMSYAATVRLADMVRDYRKLDNPSARAAFLKSFLDVWAYDVERSWPFICQTMQWVEQERLYANAQLFGDQQFADFKSFFEARLKKPFALWYELEQTFHFVTNYAPELIDKTFGEANKARMQSHGGDRGQEHDAAGHFVKGTAKPQPDNISLQSNYGTSRDYVVNRLKRADAKDLALKGLTAGQFADLAAKVETRKIPASAAAIEAGFRKLPLSRLDRIRRLLVKLSQIELRKIRAEIDDLLR